MYVNILGKKIEIENKYDFINNFILDELLSFEEAKINLNELSDEDLFELLEDAIEQIKDNYPDNNYDLLIILLKYLIKKGEIKKEDLENLKLNKDIKFVLINISNILFSGEDMFYIEKLKKYYFVSDKNKEKIYMEGIKKLLSYLLKREYDIIRKQSDNLESALDEIFNNSECFKLTSRYSEQLFKKYFNKDIILKYDYINDYDCFALKFAIKLGYISNSKLEKMKKEMDKKELCEYIFENYIAKDKEKFINDVIKNYFKTFNNFKDYIVEIDYNIKNYSKFDLFNEFKRMFDRDCVLKIIKKYIPEEEVLRFKFEDTFEDNNKKYYIYTL
jgi:hypothetical protein